MRKLILLFAFSYWTGSTAQTPVNIQTPRMSNPNHDNSTPKDFSIDQNGLNPTYTWSAETNLLQGVSIDLHPVKNNIIYLQKNNGRLLFYYNASLISSVKVKWDGDSC